MLDKIRKFYNSTKLKSNEDPFSGEYTPKEFIYVFHKEYPRFPLIPLADMGPGGELEFLLSARESSRLFSDEPIIMEEISKILNSCRISDDKRVPERRTYPSAGGRFPVEPYLIAFNIEGLDKGAYHYNMEKNSLEQLWKKDLNDKQRELVSPYLENPAATIFFTSVISRSEIKYGLRAYPYSLIEAGHMGQNILLTSTEIGIGSCPVSGFVDDTIKEILDLTDDEIPIYSISLGKRENEV